jgi:hypothetical protein
MSRLKDLRKYVDKKLNKIEDEDKRTSAISHVTIFRKPYYSSVIGSITFAQK